jgi:hypothetical protein
MSMGMLVDELDIFRCEPDGDHHLLLDREYSEVYLTAQKGQQYAVYFPGGGSVWLDIAKTRWLAQTTATGASLLC